MAGTTQGVATAGWARAGAAGSGPALANGPPYDTHLLFPGTFTAGECTDIQAHGAALVLEQGETEDDDDHDPAAMRRADVAWIAPDDDTLWIFERLEQVARAANQRYGFELDGFSEDIQYTVYDRPGAFYTWHQDGLDGGVAGRKLSLVAQLSDPSAYVGGELEFLEVAEDYDEVERADWYDRVRARGTVLAFPAWEYHRVLPLVRGTRRSLVCWVGGPLFR